MPKKKPTGSTKLRKEKVLAGLQNFGLQIYDQIVQREFPSIKMPSRSIHNIFYDQKLRQYILGERGVKRSSRNVRHIRPFTQLVWTASFVDELTRLNKTSTLRDVFYSAQAYEMSFVDQAESDNIITDLETVVVSPREDFNVFPEERSAIFGDLTIEYTVPGYEGRRLNLASHPDGMMIGPALTNAEFVGCSADKIIAIEKGALFTRFVEEKVHKKFKAILIQTAGQAPRATRALMRRLNKELGLPVVILTDGDPWGMHIAMVIISGSANAAHLRELNTPDAKWSGVWASITGDEPVIISQNGLIRNEPISRIVDPIIGSDADRAVHLDGGMGIQALCCDSSGKISMKQISGVLRHKYDDPIYEIVSAGGYRVKTTGNHSVQVFDPETCELQSKPVSELRKGELLASCFRIPKNESLTSVNVAELMLKEGSVPDDHLFVVGKESRALAKEAKSKYDKKKIRSEYPTLRNHGSTKLSYFRKENRLPTSGSLRLRYSRHSVPVILPMTRYFARLLGYHVAEGGFSGGKRGSCCELTFSRSEMNHVKDAADCILHTFRLKPKIDRFESKIRVRYGGTLLAKVISEVFASGKHVRNKRVPYIIFNVPDRFKIEFLRGYFRGDRMVNYRENTRLATKTVSRLLAADLVILLRQLNCVAYTYKQGEYYVVALANTEPIQELVDELCGRNVNVKSKLLSLPSNIIYPLRDQIKRSMPYGKRTQIHNKLFTNGGNGRIGYKKLEEILHKVSSNNNRYLETIRTLVENRVVLLPLVEKKRLNIESSTDVYDIEVSNDHTFVGGLGGMVLHNSDIVDYKLPSERLSDLDIKRLYELQKDPRYEGELWKREIETFLKVRRKAEQEAFSRYGLTYIVDEYLPAKLEAMESY